MSLALYDMIQDHSLELRARTALEIALHPERYDPSHLDFCAPFKDDPGVVTQEYRALCANVAKLGEDVDIMSVLALSSCIGNPIQMVFSADDVSVCN